MANPPPTHQAGLDDQKLFGAEGPRAPSIGLIKGVLRVWLPAFLCMLITGDPTQRKWSGLAPRDQKPGPDACNSLSMLSCRSNFTIQSNA